MIRLSGNGSVHDWVVFGIGKDGGQSALRLDDAGDRGNSTCLWISSPVSLYKACMRG